MGNRFAAALVVLASAWPVVAAAPPKEATKAALPDAEIERNIRERFAKSKISANHFQVKVQGGVARIDGKTSVIQHKGVATRLAKLGGARTVDNRIEISAEAKEKAAKNLAEGRRRIATHTSEPPRSQPRSEAKPPEPKRAVVKWRVTEPRP